MTAGSSWAWARGPSPSVTAACAREAAVQGARPAHALHGAFRPPRVESVTEVTWSFEPTHSGKSPYRWASLFIPAGSVGDPCHCLLPSPVAPAAQALQLSAHRRAGCPLGGCLNSVRALACGLTSGFICTTSRSQGKCSLILKVFEDTCGERGPRREESA